jgi:hypothetical protein
MKVSYGFEIYARTRFTKLARFLLDILAPWYTMGRFVVFALALKYILMEYMNIMQLARPLSNMCKHTGIPTQRLKN